MNPTPLHLVADQHIRELRQRAAGRRTAADHRAPRPGNGAVRPPGLRSYLGFALVEAGFHLLETGPAGLARGAPRSR
jgi:hypothetical protein